MNIGTGCFSPDAFEGSDSKYTEDSRLSEDLLSLPRRWEHNLDGGLVNVIIFVQNLQLRDNVSVLARF